MMKDITFYPIHLFLLVFKYLTLIALIISLLIKVKLENAILGFLMEVVIIWLVNKYSLEEFFHKHNH